jgi:hypothetical protein
MKSCKPSVHYFTQKIRIASQCWGFALPNHLARVITTSTLKNTVGMVQDTCWGLQEYHLDSRHSTTRVSPSFNLAGSQAALVLSGLVIFVFSLTIFHLLLRDDLYYCHEKVADCIIVNKTKASTRMTT